MSVTFETENWYYKKAKHHGPKRTGSLRHIVIHSAETPMDSNAARDIQNYFARGDVVASSHTMVDNKEIVQCVYDSYVAYAAPGANHDGYQIEQAGYAKFTRKQWLSTYGAAQIKLVASNVAQISLKYDIPLEHLSESELKKNYKGIVYHDTVSDAFKRSSHWDPGNSYPIDVLLEYANGYREGFSGSSAPATKDPLPPFDYEVVVTYASEADRVAAHALAHTSPVRTPFRVLPAGHEFFVGVEISVGHKSNAPYSHTVQGSNGKETGEMIFDLIRTPSWGSRVYAQGNQLAALREQGEETHE